MKYLYILCSLLLLSCGTKNTEEKTVADTTTAASATPDTISQATPEENSVDLNKEAIEYRLQIHKKLPPLTLYIFTKDYKIGLANADKKIVQTFPVSDIVDFEREYYQDPASFISTEDFNFDGYKDLMLLTSSGTGGRWFDIYLYDASDNTFKIHDELSKLTSPTTDSINKTVSMYDIGGMAGGWYNFVTYKWEDGKLVSIREEDQTSDSDNVEIFIRTISLPGPDGKMKIASSVKIEQIGEEKEKHCLLQGEWTEFDKDPKYLFVNSADQVIRVDGRNGECE